MGTSVESQVSPCLMASFVGAQLSCMSSHRLGVMKLYRDTVVGEIAGELGVRAVVGDAVRVVRVVVPVLSWKKTNGLCLGAYSPRSTAGRRCRRCSPGTSSRRARVLEQGGEVRVVVVEFLAEGSLSVVKVRRRSCCCRLEPEVVRLARVVARRVVVLLGVRAGLGEQAVDVGRAAAALDVDQLWFSIRMIKTVWMALVPESAVAASLPESSAPESRPASKRPESAPASTPESWPASALPASAPASRWCRACSSRFGSSDTSTGACPSFDAQPSGHPRSSATAATAFFP